MFEDTPHDHSLADPLPADPFGLLLRWLIEAQSSGALNPDAMVVGTLDEHGHPRARTVLCRGVDTVRGALMFYTNRESAKGRQLASRARASATFYWDALGRQLCSSGVVEPATDAESDAYWNTRPRLSQLAARGSRQSQPIASRAALLAQINDEAERFGGVDGTQPVPARRTGAAIASCSSGWSSGWVRTGVHTTACCGNGPTKGRHGSSADYSRDALTASPGCGRACGRPWPVSFDCCVPTGPR